ncbi:MAG: methyl-accepting chemotaxis protein [Spirochaetales bacterium]|nr:methyl-accepting chemotaxis protein [Spirochaetales bacterium]
MRIYTKVMLILVIIILCIMTIYEIISYCFTRTRMAEDLEERSERIQARLSFLFADPMWRTNEQLIETIILNEMKDDTIIAVILTDNNRIRGKVRAGGEIVNYSNLKHTKIIVGAYKESVSPVTKEGINLGTIKIYFSGDSIHKALREEIIRIVIQLLIIVALIIIGLNIVLRYFITSPINKVKNRIGEIARGEGDLTQTIDIKKRDEIGLLSINFNSFISKLNNIVRKIKESSGQSIGVRNTLDSTTVEITKTLATILGRISLIREKISGLDENIRSVTRTIKATNENVKDQREHIEDQSSAVNQSTVSVNEMVSSLKTIEQISRLKKESTEKLVRTVKKGGEILSETRQVILDINSRIGNIGEILSIINEITEKTNLLAMNAAIEAAQSGEAGKGFSVVADEIKNLAESTDRNARNIGEMLGDIMDKIDTATDYSNETEKAFAEIEREVHDVSGALEEVFASTTEVASGGGQVLQSMSLLTDISSKVNETSAKINDGAGDIAEAIDVVTAISQDVFSAISEISQRSAEISEEMKKMNALTSSLSRAVDNLNSEINLFITK